MAARELPSKRFILRLKIAAICGLFFAILEYNIHERVVEACGDLHQEKTPSEGNIGVILSRDPIADVTRAGLLWL